MAKAYHHVTRDERSQIRFLKAMRYCVSDIAKRLKRHRSTISREIKRNSGLRSYHTEQADRKAMERRSAVSRKPKKMTAGLRDLISKGIKEGWAPEQVSGYFKLKGESLLATRAFTK